jgi:hypothetical protein
MERTQITSGAHRLTLRNAEFGIRQDLEFSVRPDEVHALRREFDVAGRSR